MSVSVRAEAECDALAPSYTGRGAAHVVQTFTPHALPCQAATRAAFAAVHTARAAFVAVRWVSSAHPRESSHSDYVPFNPTAIEGNQPS